MATMDDQFREKSKKMKEMKVATTDEDKLTLYKLYKQSTIGNCNIPPPSVLNVTARAKYMNWNSMTGTSQLDAQTAYCAYVDELVARLPETSE